MLEKIHIFVTHFITRRRVKPAKLCQAWFMLVTLHTAVSPPVWSVNAPTAFWVKCNGSGGTVSFRPYINYTNL